MRRTQSLSFRRITENDLPFLARVYASTRAEELAVTDWSDEQKAAFLDAQFRAQHAHYQQYYPHADWLVTMRGGEDIGRLYIERWPTQHRLIDIAFLPPHRGKGLGEALLRDLMDEAAAAGKAVSIHVEKFNPAMRLYLTARIQDRGRQGRPRSDALDRAAGLTANPGFT